MTLLNDLYKFEDERVELNRLPKDHLDSIHAFSDAAVKSINKPLLEDFYALTNEKPSIAVPVQSFFFYVHEHQKVSAEMRLKKQFLLQDEAKALSVDPLEAMKTLLESVDSYGKKDEKSKELANQITHLFIEPKNNLELKLNDKDLYEKYKELSEEKDNFAAKMRFENAADAHSEMVRLLSGHSQKEDMPKLKLLDYKKDALAETLSAIGIPNEEASNYKWTPLAVSMLNLEEVSKYFAPHAEAKRNFELSQSRLS